MFLYDDDFRAIFLQIALVLLCCGKLVAADESYCDANCQPAVDTDGKVFCVASNPSKYTLCSKGQRSEFECSAGFFYDRSFSGCRPTPKAPICQCDPPPNANKKQNLRTLTKEVSSTTTTRSPRTYSTICYYTNWAQYRAGAASFKPENIDFSLCTHIVYAFLKFNATHIDLLEWNDGQMIAQIQSLKAQRNPSLKLIASIGGWNAGTAIFNQIAATASNRSTFNRNALAFLRQFNFDGLDVDWEYPDNNTKASYTAWLHSLRLDFEAEAGRSKKPRFILGAAISAGKWALDRGYDIQQISRSLDFISVMSYDYHGTWESVTGFNAPLYPRATWSADLTVSTVWYTIDYLLSKGAPASKLMMGIPLYGHSYTLKNASDNGVGSPANGTGLPGRFTTDAGFNSYYETCMLSKCPSYKVSFDHETKVPYLYSGTNWITTEDVASVKAKAELAMAKGLGGVMYWALDLDDFNDICQNGVKYPLMMTVSNTLKGAAPPTLLSGNRNETFCETAPLPQPSSTSTTSTTKQTSTTATTEVATKPSSDGGEVTYSMVCYYTNWAQYRVGAAAFWPEDIDYSLCTHIIYAFLKFNETHIGLSEWNDAEMIGRIQNLTKLTNPSLKLLASIGGWNAGPAVFTKIAATPSSRSTFNKNAVAFLRQFNFDGLDVDWEYPDNNTKSSYAAWFQSLRNAFEDEAQSSGKPRLILGAAISAGVGALEKGYDIQKISNSLDLILVMSYDYHGTWESVTGYNAPLYAKSTWPDGSDLAMLTTSYTIDYLLEKGAPASKLMLGIPFFGHCFTLKNANQNGVDSPVIGAGLNGRYTNSSGFNAYYETCMLSKCPSYKTVFDYEAYVPYLYSGTNWISTEDVESVKAKAEFAMAYGLGGVMYWALDLEDFADICENGVKFPLMKTIANTLKGGHVPILNSAKNVKFCDAALNPPTTTTLQTSTTTTSTPAPPVRNLGKSYSTICYYSNWAQYRTGAAFTADHIDYSLCTHIVYAFLKFNATHVDLLEPNDAEMIARILELRGQSNPNLKLIASIGGWDVGSVTFTEIVDSASSRSTFNKNALAFLRQYRFDGLDVDWQFPDNFTKTNYVAWLQLLKLDFGNEAKASGKPRLILGAAISGIQAAIEHGYDIKAISECFDFISIMSYDYHGFWEPVTGHNAPLYPRSSWPPGSDLAMLTSSYTVKYLLGEGAPASKLMLGIPFFGHSFTLQTAGDNQVGSPAVSSGLPGRLSKSAGFNTYYETCMLSKCPSYKVLFDDEAKVPYLYSGTNWVSTENVASVRAKTEFAIANGLGGVMLSVLDYDDFSDLCKNGVKYPLLKTVYNTLKGEAPPTLSSGQNESFCNVLFKEL